MKNAHIIIIAILIAITSACKSKNTNEKQDTGNFGRFKFKEDAYDFGVIKNGDTATHVFKFINIGKTPLIIKDISTGCGCTVAKWTKKPVLPKDSGSVTVMFSKRHDPGMHSKLVIITANTSYPYTVLKIFATIK